jgi:pSer/pThr/pTyr-binding forkhead associated (FHA) protein
MYPTTLSPVVGAARLVVTHPAERAGWSYPLDGEVTVGRAPGCGISLPDDTFVSQVHARVFARDGGWWVEDLGSTNGTYLNDGPVTSAMAVRTGDRVQFGQTVAELHP